MPRPVLHYLRCGDFMNTKKLLIFIFSILLIFSLPLLCAANVPLMPVEDIRIAGRKTQGVILFRTAENEKVVSVTWLDADAEDEEELEEEAGSEVLGESVADTDDSLSDQVSEPETESDDE